MEPETRSPEDEARSLELLRAVDFGLRIQQFLEGPIGKRIVEESNGRRDELRRELMDLDYRDPKQAVEIDTIRQEHAAIAHWQDFFNRYMREGREAETLLHEQDEGLHEDNLGE